MADEAAQPPDDAVRLVGYDAAYDAAIAAVESLTTDVPSWLIVVAVNAAQPHIERAIREQS